MINLIKKFEEASGYMLFFNSNKVIIKILPVDGGSNVAVVLDAKINVIKKIDLEEGVTNLLLFDEQYYFKGPSGYSFLDIDFNFEHSGQIFMINNKAIFQAEGNVLDSKVHNPKNPMAMDVYIDFKKKYTTLIYGRPHSIGESYFFREHSDEFGHFYKKIDINTGEILWEFHVEQQKHLFKTEYPLIKEFGFNNVQPKEQVYKNQLWFTERNGSLICIDNGTGKLIKFIRDNPEHIEFAGSIIKYSVLPFVQKCHLDKKRGKIVMLHRWYYWELDLETFEIDYYFIKDYVERMECLPDNKSCLYEDHIIFISNRNRKIAAFNTKTREIDFSLPFVKKFQMASKIGMIKDKLFVVFKDLQRKYNLHVYKVDSGITSKAI